MDFEHNRVYKIGNLTKLENNELDERRLDTEIKEHETEYIVEIQLIGFDKDEIVIFIENNILYVEANRQDIIDEENEDYTLQEHNYAYCQRSFSLQGINAKAIYAYYENNLVYIQLPKIK